MVDGHIVFNKGYFYCDFPKPIMMIINRGIIITYYNFIWAFNEKRKFSDIFFKFKIPTNLSIPIKNNRNGFGEKFVVFNKSKPFR